MDTIPESRWGAATSLLRRWWVAFGGIALILGLYMQAGSLLAGAAAAAAALVILYLAGRWILEAYDITKSKYPASVRRIAVLEQEMAGHELERESYKEEGALAVLGSYLASSLTVPPDLIGMGNDRGDVILFAKSSDQVNQLARFYVEGRLDGERKGVVQVVSEAGQTPIRLLCVEKTVPEFWSRLAVLAVTSDDPPGGVVLRPHDGIETYLVRVTQRLSKAVEE